MVVLLLETVRRWPWQAWPLQGVAVGLLAGGAAWCLDEPAAGVVDVVRGSRLAHAGSTRRADGVAGGWGIGLWRAWDQLFDHPEEVALQGVAATLAAAAWTSARRGSGESQPGNRLALVIVPVATAWALVRPLQRSMPVFPYGFDDSYGSWRTSSLGWATLAAASTVWLMWTLSEVGRRTTAHRPGADPS